jgi:hypothetical protein
VKIYRLRGSRQGHYGIPVPAGPARMFLQLQESHGEAFLSTQYGRAYGAPIRILPATATATQIFNALAELEEWPETWDQQLQRLRTEYPDELDTIPIYPSYSL